MSKRSERLKKRGRILTYVSVTGMVVLILLEILGVIEELGIVGVLATLATFIYAQNSSLEGTIVEQNEKLIGRSEGIESSLDDQTELLKQIRDSVAS